jgi:hypothetical protein
MVLSVSSAWATAMQGHGVKPIYLVDFEFGPAAYLTVNSYADGAALNATVSITIVAGGSSTIVLTAGTDFSAITSNAVTAQNIAAAINAHSTLGTLIYAFAIGATVLIIPETGVSTITALVFASSNDASWNAYPYRLPQTVTIVSGDAMYGDYPNSLSNIAPVASSIDLETRAVTIGDVELTLSDDGVLADYLERAYPKGRKITIKLGARSLSIGDFVQIGVFVFDDYRRDGKSLVVQCVEPFAQVAENEITGQFVNMHPLEAIRQILSIAGVPTSLINNTSLESTDAAYSDISHWAISRHTQYPPLGEIHYAGPNNGVDEPTNARDLITDLSTVLDGSLSIREDGLYTFARFDIDGAAVRHLTEDDIADFEPESTIQNLKNSITVAGVSLPNNEKNDGTLLFQAEDEISVRMASITGTNRNFSMPLESEWLGIPSVLYSTITNSDLQFDILGGPCCGFAGTRVSASAQNLVVPTQRVADTLASGRLATLLLTDGVNREIVEANNFVFGTIDGSPSTAISMYGYHVPDIHVASAPYAWLPHNGGDDQFYLQLRGQYTVRGGGRGLRGTSAAGWVGFEGAAITSGAPSGQGFPDRPVLVFDITIPVAMIEYARLRRFGAGCPVVRFRTSLRHFDLQLRDFITFDHRRYLNYSKKSGANSGVVWEIISKEIVAKEDSPGVVFTCARVRDDVTWTPSLSYPVYTPVISHPPQTIDDVVTDNSDVPLTVSTGETVTRR